MSVKASITVILLVGVGAKRNLMKILTAWGEEIWGEEIWGGELSRIQLYKLRDKQISLRGGTAVMVALGYSKSFVCVWVGHWLGSK